MQEKFQEKMQMTEDGGGLPSAAAFCTVAASGGKPPYTFPACRRE
jgi:hypothetical protein